MVSQSVTQSMWSVRSTEVSLVRDYWPSCECSEHCYSQIQPKLHSDSLMAAIHHSNSVSCRLLRKGDGTPGRFVRQTLPVNITRTNAANLQIKQVVIRFIVFYPLTLAAFVSLVFQTGSSFTFKLAGRTFVVLGSIQISQLTWHLRSCIQWKLLNPDTFQTG